MLIKPPPLFFRPTALHGRRPWAALGRRRRRRRRRLTPSQFLFLRAAGKGPCVSGAPARVCVD